jgi:hypothetical protein
MRGTEKVSDLPAKPSTLWFWIALLIIVALYVTLAMILPPGADTLWRLHIADTILNGKAIYKDVVEVNPPLWFWGALPAAALGGYPALVGLNLLSSLLCLWLFYALLCLTTTRASALAGVLGLACGLFLVNVAEIGQREQAFLAACALWAALAAVRFEGKTVGLPFIVAVVCFAAYGFALKHYFVLVPIAVEIALLIKLKRNWRPIRTETVALGLGALAYGIAVATLTPDFLGPILRLVDATYFGFGLNSLTLFQRQMRVLIVCAFGLVPLVCWILVKDRRPIVLMLFIALAMSFVAIIFQQKGWRYHLIGANGLSLILVAMMFQHVREKAGARLVMRLLPASLAAILYTSSIHPAIANLKTGGEEMNEGLVKIVAAQPKNHHIAILSTSPDRAFYVLARAGRPHWTRHFSMWMMPGAMTPQTDPEKEVRRKAILDQVLGEFGDDLMCTPPDLMVGEVGFITTSQTVRFDAVGLLQQKPAFKAWLADHYQRNQDQHGFVIYQLSGPKPVAQNCLTPR